MKPYRDNWICKFIHVGIDENIECNTNSEKQVVQLDDGTNLVWIDENIDCRTNSEKQVAQLDDYTNLVWLDENIDSELAVRSRWLNLMMIQTLYE
jgi:hypothetical protein